jgi:uncharacterized protein (TIGR02118 family)
MICMTIVYPWKDGATFDFDYYQKHHVPLVATAMGGKFDRAEIRRGVLAADGGAAPYVCVANIWLRGTFSSKEDFASLLGGREPEIIKDVPNFTNLMPIIQYDEVVGNR